MKGKIKANTVDKYLRPIRLQIIELIRPNSQVIEYGCGNGDLLFKLSAKIESGIGIDISKQFIEYANKRVKREQFKNLEFKLLNIVENNYSGPSTDYSIASLLFHLISKEQALDLLEKMLSRSETVIICGFTKPQSRKQKTLLWLDQRFTGCYSNFREYAKNEFTEGLLNALENTEYRSIETFDPVIKIYLVRKSKQTEKSV